MICRSLLTVKLVAFVPPNVTAVAPVRLVPVIVTLVPPFDVPESGRIVRMIGAACAETAPLLTDGATLVAVGSMSADRALGGATVAGLGVAVTDGAGVSVGALRAAG